MAQNNSVLTNGGTTPDWIELANASNNAVSLAGWSLSNDSNARKFVFPAGTNISAGGFLLVFCDSQTNAPGLHSGFSLSTFSQRQGADVGGRSACALVRRLCARGRRRRAGSLGAHA